MGVFIVFALVVAGFFIVGVVRTDVRTERAYGLLALALLAAVALGFLWPPVLDRSARADSSGTDDLAFVVIAGFYILATILAIALLGIAGLIEMAVARQWWWFATLLAAMALMAITIFLPLFSNLLTTFPFPNSFILRDANWLASEAVVLLVCVGYGVRATWFRSPPAT
ncbi:MAG TPA: hypothetical protein VFQ25_16800 [Ktedonobacterales bacterium]|nr:hypothetical protein [Ktedonobacterales bacterium]